MPRVKMPSTEHRLLGRCQIEHALPFGCAAPLFQQCTLFDQLLSEQLSLGVRHENLQPFRSSDSRLCNREQLAPIPQIAYFPPSIAWIIHVDRRWTLRSVTGACLSNLVTTAFSQAKWKPGIRRWFPGESS